MSLNSDDLAKVLANLPPAQRLAVLAALKSQGKVAEQVRFNLEEILFKKQLDVLHNYEDKNVIVCSRRCLAEGTLIKTEHGVLPIEKIQQGMQVWGYNEDGTVSLAPVLKVFDNGEKECVRLRYSKQEIVCTKDHKFLCLNHKGEKVITKAGDIGGNLKVVCAFTPSNSNGKNVPRKVQRRTDFKGYSVDTEDTVTRRTYDLAVGNETNLYLLASGEVTHNSGKSYFVATLLLHTAMTTAEDSLFYIGINKTAARRVIWGILTKMIRDYSLDCKVNDHTLAITFPNHTTIMIEGAKDASTIERLRGVKSSLAVIDEAQSIPVGLGITLVQDVVLPFLSDNAGKLFLTGTPDALCQSVLYKAWKGEEKGWRGFKPFHWNVTHNEKFPRFLSGKSTPEGYLQEVMEATGYTADSPTFLREYLGQFVKDEGSLVYNFDYRRDVCESLPNGDWYYVLSGDTGFKDSDAIIVVAFSYTSPVAYVVDEFTKDGLGVDEFIALYMEFYNKYNPIASVIDYGGGGLKVIESINQRYKINTKPCKKWNPKHVGAAVVSSEFQARRLKVLSKCETTIAQLESITWISKTDRDGVVKRIIPDGFQVRDAHGEVVSDDCVDALLYAMSEIRNYLAVEEIMLSDEEKMRRELDNHKKSLIDKMRQKELETKREKFY